ncbi:MFS transporter [Aeromonas veronii]|uniref:MFS transporter n=1 Tax=Aeromonas veronii TaxID=654 RepID=UPI003B9E1518
MKRIEIDITGESGICDYRPVTFWLLWLGMLATSTGSMVLLLGISSIIYIESNSAIFSSMVFVSQWFLPIFLVNWIGKIGRVNQPAIALICIECALFFTLPLIGEEYYQLFIGLVLRGLLNTCGEFLRSTCIKRYIPEERLEKTVTHFNTSRYLGIALAGLLSYLGMNDVDYHSLVLIAACCHVVSFFAYLFIPKLKVHNNIHNSSGVWHVALKEITKNEKIRNSIYMLVLTTAVLQGFHTVARSSLPIALYKGDVSSGLFLQSGIGPVILLALWLYSYLLKINASRLLIYNVALFFCGFFLLAMTYTDNLMVGVSLYWAYFFSYEIIYTKLNNDLMMSTTRDNVGDVISVSNAIVSVSMAIGIIFLGSIVDRFDFKIVITLCAMATFAFLISSLLKYKKEI